MSHYYMNEHGDFKCAYCVFATPHLNYIRRHVEKKHGAVLEPLPEYQPKRAVNDLTPDTPPVTLVEVPPAPEAPVTAVTEAPAKRTRKGEGGN